MDKFKHYIRIDGRGIVIDGYSDAFREPQEGDICINEQGGYQFRLFPGGEENPSLTDGEGAHLYYYDSTQTPPYRDTTQEERTAETAPPIDTVRVQMQAQNKAALAKHLAAHPLLWTDGKLYGVTFEDQQEMTLNLIQYQAAVQAGLPAKLEWHSVKSACTVWTLEDYTGLTLAVSGMVYPYLRHQEQVKAAIYAAATVEGLEGIVIDYGSVAPGA